MNQLDIEHINAQSPYIVEEADEENFFKFFTEHDVHYSVGFMPDDSLMQSEAYHLITSMWTTGRRPATER